MIHVIAEIDLKPGVRDAFLEVFRANVPNVLAEDGCIAYAPTVDLPSGLSAQGPARGDTVTVVERWESLEHLRAHLAAPHMAVYRERVKDWVIGVTLRVLQEA